MIKRIKHPEEWKNIIGRLHPQNFEHLCYQLIRAMPGFANVDLRNGSYDGGRDIDATYKSKAPDGITEITERWRFECKKYSNGVSFDDVSVKITQASLNKIDKFVIMSNMSLTPSCKDEIAKIQPSLNCKVLDWTGVHFQDILFQYPDVCRDFFPDEDLPQHFLDTKQPQEFMDITQRAGSNFGIELKIGLKKEQKPPATIEEAADYIKDALLNLKNVDLNIKSLIYQQVFGFFLSINREEDALYFVDESLKITPKNIAAVLNKGYVLEKLDKLPESSACYDNVLKMDSQNKFALNNKAHNLAREGDFEKALELVDKALKIDPDYAIAINSKSSIMSNLGRSEEALDFLERMLKKHQDSRILLASKVELLIKLLDLKEAMRVNDQWLEMDPENIDAINNKGVIYDRNSKYQKPEKYLPLAMECFDKVMANDKNYALGWSNKIISLFKIGRKENAESLVEQAIATFPNDAFILNEKGRFLLEKGDAKNALKLFDKALKYRFLDKLFLNRGRSLLILKKYKEAAETADRLLKRDGKNSDAWALKSEALKRLHQVTKAEICFKRARKFKKVPKSLLE